MYAQSMKRQCRTGNTPNPRIKESIMFENSLAKVLEDPTDNNLPHYEEALIKKNTSLSPAGPHVLIHC